MALRTPKDRAAAAQRLAAMSRLIRASRQALLLRSASPRTVTAWLYEATTHAHAVRLMLAPALRRRRGRVLALLLVAALALSCGPAPTVVLRHADAQIEECRRRGGFPQTEISFAYDPPFAELKACVLPCGPTILPTELERERD